MKKLLLSVAFISLCGLASCDKSQKSKEFRVEGEVIAISGTLPLLVSSSGAFLSNNSVQIGDPSLVYSVRLDDGEINTINVADSDDIPRVTLLSRVCVGSRISYTVSEAKPGSEKTDPHYGVGTAYSNDIFVTKRCQK